MQLAVQFSPGKLLVHLGHRSSVSFDYDVHDGRWHSLALGVRGHRVFLHTSCGEKSLHADLNSKKVEALDPEGLFLLGKMNPHSVPFEGAVCQFDIYPSAKAAHNYCDYIKKHCREADTYRPAFPPLLPLLSTDPNFTPLSLTELDKVQRPTLASSEENARTTLFVPSDHSLIRNKTSGYQMVSTPKPGAVSVPPPEHSGLESPLKFPMQTVPASPGVSETPPTSLARESDSQERSQASVDSPVSIRPSDMKSKDQTTAASTPRSDSNTYISGEKQPTSAAPKKTEPEETNVQDADPTWLLLVTPAATDGSQTFDLEPTHFSLLAGPPGLKGEPGPPVSTECEL